MDTDLIDDQQPPVVVPPDKTTGLGDKEKQPQESVPGLEVAEKPELGPEVKEAGVEAIGEPKLKVDKRLEEIGVRVSGAARPSQPAPAQPLPLSDDQILAGQNQSIASSWRWLAAWCLRQLKKAQIILRKFHGQVIRIKKIKN